MNTIERLETIDKYEHLLDLLWEAHEFAKTLPKPYRRLAKRLFVGENNIDPSGIIDEAQSDLIGLRTQDLQEEFLQKAEKLKAEGTFDTEKHWQEYIRDQEEIYREILE